MLFSGLRSDSKDGGLMAECVRIRDLANVRVTTAGSRVVLICVVEFGYLENTGIAV